MLIPWQVYQQCGDEYLLTNTYKAMKAYTDYCTHVGKDNIVSFGLADWEPAKTRTPASVTDTAYYYQDALIVARTAALMGKTADSLQYSNLAARIKVSFNAAFFNPKTSLYAGGTQTAQSCALYQGLVESNQITAVAAALAKSVQQNGDKIDTGNLGSKYLLRALCDYGHSDVAMTVACQTNYPGWGNWVMRGATTLWETWSGTGKHDSLNHIMMGEDYDAHRQVTGWDEPGLDETGWVPVRVRHEPSVILCAQVTQPIRELCELKPKKLTEPEPGHLIYDLGQNMVGVARIKVSAPAGTEVTIRQGEMLNPDGTLYTKNLRGAKATDHYTCRGTGVETWQPRFTYHACRQQFWA